MQKKDQEQQLQLFFKQDPFYLKNYVKEHPNNKMAWYLLGREYEAQGKQGKALYCYAQAGEVYEAYENQKVRLPSGATEFIEKWQAERKRRRRMTYVRMIMLGLLSMAAILLAPGFPAGTNVPTKAELPQGITEGQLQATKVYYLHANKTKDKVGWALQEMLLRERVSSFAILAQGIPMGDSSWIGWLKKPEVLLSVEAKDDASQQQIYYHDAASCGCQPSDPQKAESIVAAWMTKQEQELSLRSAVAAYMRKYGQAPESVSKLTAAYPNNVLPGLTPYMQELFAQEKEALVSDAAVWMKQTPEAASSAAPAKPADLTKPLTEPMRILVDKKAHRLAVVSGNMIVRSYPVGLGASRTPEGSFVISEKVRNPNGKSNGEFGSRGMTLSDKQYAIHGTNKPSSIGKDESLGCVRMQKEDLEELYDLVPMGTTVTIGNGMLPDEIGRSQSPFQLPIFSDDTNPGKVYKWLD